MLFPFKTSGKIKSNHYVIGTLLLDPKNINFRAVKAIFLKWWYLFRYGIKVGGIDGTMYPSTGKGNYVDVHVKGPFIDIVDHSSNVLPRGTIRLIPYQPNHGVMIEQLTPGGTVRWRIVCDYYTFYNMGFHPHDNSKHPLKDATLIEINKI